MYIKVEFKGVYITRTFLMIKKKLHIAVPIYGPEIPRINSLSRKYQLNSSDTKVIIFVDNVIKYHRYFNRYLKTLWEMFRVCLLKFIKI